MNKFREIKNKGKQRAKELPIPEPKVLEDVEVSVLLDSLNEKPKLETHVFDTSEYVKIPEILPPSVEVSGKYLVAYCVAFNEKKNKFQKIEVDIDPISGYSKIRSVVDWSDDPITGLHKLNRILSLKLIKREEKF